MRERMADRALMIVSVADVLREYDKILSTEERLKIIQARRENMILSTEVWMVHDKDTGETVAVADTKTMAIKRACAEIEFPAVSARKSSWLNMERYSLKRYELKEQV